MYSVKISSYFLSIFVVLFFIGCGSSELKVEKPKIEIVKEKAPIKAKIKIVKPKIDSTPKWYKNKELNTTSHYEVIAYAKAKSKEIAINTAKSNIIFEMFNKANKSSIGQIDMTKMYTLKQEQKDGEYFVALSYVNSDLVYKIKSSVGELTCNDNNISTYIQQTPIFKRLNCNLNIKLERQNKGWYLRYKENLFALSDDELKEFFIDKKNSNFDFEISKKNLVEEDKFYFTFKTKEKGYITLLDIYKNGIVTLLDVSIDIKEKLTIPPQEEGYSYEAITLKQGENTHDLYVAIFTKEPIELAIFEYENPDMTNNESAHKLGDLIDMLDGYEYSTILVETEAK